jgi:hypothetical protein
VVNAVMHTNNDDAVRRVHSGKWCASMVHTHANSTTVPVNNRHVHRATLTPVTNTGHSVMIAHAYTATTVRLSVNGPGACAHVHMTVHAHNSMIDKVVANVCNSTLLRQEYSLEDSSYLLFPAYLFLESIRKSINAQFTATYFQPTVWNAYSSGLWVRFTPV